ncbi:MAG: DMT family transporter [Marinobacter sp.]|uniref:DMT family transporter n=1 Tax=Marinobacter sp. TaxID=50741 RepID=UPI00299DFA52|nr:DMT family transporter [Marinobacter sp.]MDX1634929.1 DMT family transporter [Marinobacter sp.]
MIAFAGNSLLCRAALRDTDIDAATFTTVRLVSGALTLWLLVAARRLGPVSAGGSWLSGLALFVYAGAFSFAYLGLTTAMGALLLFGAVQITMISVGHWRGDRMQPLQWLGFAAAFGGLVGLLLPGLSAPPLLNSVLMISAGIAWGVYSLRGRGAGEPTLATAGNFVRSVPFTLVLSVLSLSMLGQFRLDTAGVGYGVASGAITSALGYAIWYMALPALKAATAATVQLTVPLIAAVGGILLLSEPLTLRLVLAGLAILGGVWLVIQQKQRQPLPLR